MMSDLRERVVAAREKLASLTREVCGACTQNCCHQGTMMGTQGLRRLHKGLLLDPSLADRLRRGLAQRGEEVAHDLQVAETVIGLLQTSRQAPDDDPEFADLLKRLEEFRGFVLYMASDYAFTSEGMSRLLLYSAVRSNLLRAVRQFPGGEAALARLSGDRGSFRFRGRKMAPPRCIFHYDECLAEQWKPIKCADFFCSSEPNLLARLRQSMGFDEFVLANVRLADPGFVQRLLRLESSLGPAFWEPKVVIGPAEGAEAFARETVTLLGEDRRLQLREDPGRFMRATNEILREISQLPEGQNMVCTSGSVDGAALYELAVALQRARSTDWHGGFVLLAHELAPQSFFAHPLWEDEMISQPLGGLEIYLV